MRTPCEIMVKAYLPAVRYQTSKILFKKGHTQTEISKALGLTQASVSKYLSDKVDPNVRAMARMKEVKETAEQIARDAAHSKPQETISLICNTCLKLRAEHKVCIYHDELVPGISDKCELCK